LVSLLLRLLRFSGSVSQAEQQNADNK